MKKDQKCFQYPVTIALNHKQIGKHSERIIKNKPFTNKYNWKERNFQSKKTIGKHFRKIMYQLLLIFCMLKKKKYILPIFQRITQIVKNKLLF